MQVDVDRGRLSARGATFLLLFALLLLVCTFAPANAASTAIFDDEFSGGSLDSSKWRTDGNWFACQNNSQNIALAADPSNPANSFLHLYLGQPCTAGGDLSASIIQTAAYQNARPFSFKYGYVEARVKIPAANGSWPAFWLASLRRHTRELDIGEWGGSQPTSVFMNIHYPDGTFSGGTYTGTDWSTDFHTIGLDWKRGSLAWYVDGSLKFQVTDSRVPGETMYVLLDHACGGWLNNDFCPTSASSPPNLYDFQVDWVRVWSVKP
jgi:beta-glucanase (GH16 family)